jgi:hypothetical protein
MKHVVRVVVLMLALASLYVTAVPQVAAVDGGPLCGDPACKGLPPM